MVLKFLNRLLQGSLIIQQPVLTTYCAKTYLRHLSVLEHQNFADHYSVTIRWFGKNVENTNYTYRDTSFLKPPSQMMLHKSSLRDHLSKNKSLILECDDADAAFKNFNYLFLEITDKFSPLRTYGSKLSKVQKCYCNEIKNLWHKKNAAHCKFKQTRQEVYLKKFQRLRKNFKIW